MSDHYQLVMSKLTEFGLLLESDPKLPNVCTLITGETMRGSWWSHPMSHQIFAVNEQLDDDPEVMLTKLVSGKVTFAHRALWPEILAVGEAREEWQLQNLSTPARSLLEQIDKAGSLTTDELGSRFGPKPGDAARDLERRLLIHAEQFHTDSGAHAKRLETWGAWAKRVGFTEPAITQAAARKKLEERLTFLNKTFEGVGLLPWQERKARASS